MKKQGIPAFYFPTTVVFVDDSKDFLMNFSLQFDQRLAYQLYSSPHLALKAIQQQLDSQLNQECFSQYAEAVGCPTTNQTINLDLTAIQRKVYDAERFREVSVVVVDYAMPDLNGLEFCERLRDKPIRKILLTGQADAQTAINAFNAGIIDQFIMKNDPNVIDKINTAIMELQHRYFQDASDFVVKVLAIDSPNFLQDPIFCKTFADLCKKKDIVEYYLTQNTGTFLLLSSKGRASWLIISNQQDIDMYSELGRDVAVAPPVLARLNDGKHLLHFWQPDKYYEIDPIEWESYIYPAQKLQSNELYYYAVVDNPAISNLDADGITSYAHYLECLDNVLELTA